MHQAPDQASVEWLIRAIDTLPSDNPVPLRTPGYNKYTTQKAHWLGWLDPAAKTGASEGERTGRVKRVQPHRRAQDAALANLGVRGEEGHGRFGASGGGRERRAYANESGRGPEACSLGRGPSRTVEEDANGMSALPVRASQLQH